MQAFRSGICLRDKNPERNSLSEVIATLEFNFHYRLSSHCYPTLNELDSSMLKSKNQVTLFVHYSYSSFYDLRSSKNI